MVTGRGEGEDGKYVRRHPDSIIAELVWTRTHVLTERTPAPMSDEYLEYILD